MSEDDPLGSTKLRKPLGIKHAATLYMALRIVGAGIGLFNTLLLARLMGARQYGTMALALAGANLIATIAALGLPYWVTREVAVLRDGNQFCKIASVSKTSLQLCLMSSLLPAILATVSYGSFLCLRVPEVYPKFPIVLIILSLVFIPITSFNQVRAGLMRGLGRAVTAEFPDVVVRPLFISLAIGCAISLSIRWNAAVGMIFQIGGGAVSLSVGAALLWRSVKFGTNDDKKIADTRALDKARIPVILRESPHFLLIMLLATMDSQLTIYLIGMLSGPEKVGIFQVALQPLNVILMGLIAVGVYAQPRIAATWAKHERKKTQEVVRNATKVSSQVAIGVGVGLILFANPIIRLYGASYAHAAELLRILAIGQIVYGVTGPIGVVMLMTGNQKKIFHFDAMFLVLKVAMLSIGVVCFGLVGAATAEVLYLVTMRLVGAMFVRKHTGLVTTLWGHGGAMER